MMFARDACLLHTPAHYCNPLGTRRDTPTLCSANTKCVRRRAHLVLSGIGLGQRGPHAASTNKEQGEDNMSFPNRCCVSPLYDVFIKTFSYYIHSIRGSNEHVLARARLATDAQRLFVFCRQIRFQSLIGVVVNVCVANGHFV